MDVKLVNPFINATVKVLETMAGTKATPGKPFVKKDRIARGDVTGIIGVTGEGTGTMSVTFDEGSILGLVSKMFGEPLKKLNSEVSDAVGELTNMISGQARRKLEEDGRHFEAAIPSVITGKDHEINHITSGPIVAVPFTTDGGRFTIEICLDKNIFKKMGYTQLIEADDGTTALEQLKKQKIDMIVSDWNMPKMSGLDLLKTVRATDEYREIPFIMVTAEAQKKNVIDAVQAGVSNYIVKPFTEEQIVEKLQKVFGS